MKKSVATVLALAVMLTMVTPAFAGATKVPLKATRSPTAACSSLNLGDAVGFVIFNLPKGKNNFMVTVGIQRGVPKGNYKVWLGYLTNTPFTGACGGSWLFLGWLAVDSLGEGSFHWNGNLNTGTQQYIVAIDNPTDALTLYATSFVTLSP